MAETLEAGRVAVRGFVLVSVDFGLAFFFENPGLAGAPEGKRVSPPVRCAFVSGAGAASGTGCGTTTILESSSDPDLAGLKNITSASLVAESVFAVAAESSEEGEEESGKNCRAFDAGCVAGGLLSLFSEGAAKEL